MRYVCAIVFALFLLFVFAIHMVVLTIDTLGWRIGQYLPAETAHHLSIWWIKYISGPWFSEMDSLNEAMVSALELDN